MHDRQAQIGTICRVDASNPLVRSAVSLYTAPGLLKVWQVVVFMTPTAWAPGAQASAAVKDLRSTASLDGVSGGVAYVTRARLRALSRRSRWRQPWQSPA